MANDVYELRVASYGAVSGFCENVLNYSQVATPPLGPNPFEIAKALGNAWNSANLTTYLACLPDSATVGSIRTRRVNNGGGPTCVLIINANGTVVSVQPSGMIAANIALYPTTPPWKEGHIYMPLVPDSFITTDTWTSAAIAAFTALINALKTVIVDALTNAWQEIIWRRKSATIDPIDAYQLMPKPTPMGRRIKPYPF